eukprot:Skav216012  [mRNA]  locus=scaffold833:281496:281906:+ [translate_table: standard]
MQALRDLVYTWWDGIQGWEDECRSRHRRTWAQYDFLVIGHLGASYGGEQEASFSMRDPIWVFDASVDLRELPGSPFQVAGLTAVGLVIMSIGAIVCLVACTLTRKVKSTTPDAVANPAVLGQPVEQPVDEVDQQAV